MKQLQNEKKENSNIYLTWHNHSQLITYSSRKLHFSIFLAELLIQLIAKIHLIYNIIYRYQRIQLVARFINNDLSFLSVVVFISLVSYKKRKLSKV